MGEALRNPRVLALSVVYFGIVSGNYGLSYWLPQIVKGVATDIGLEKVTGIPINALTGYLVAVPFAFGIVAMILWTRHSDATQERVWHVAGPATVSGLCLIAAAYLASPVLAAAARHDLRDGAIRGVVHVLDPSDRLSRPAPPPRAALR